MSPLHRVDFPIAGRGGRVSDALDALRDLDLSRHCIFLDFDGTLVELAPTPDGITVPDHLSALLAALHARMDGRLLLVSGREISSLTAHLPDFPGDIFGAHGAEMRRDGVLTRHALVGSAVVAQVQRAAAEVATMAEGLLLEKKDTGAVVHFRADPTQEALVRAAMTRIASQAPQMDLHESKMAFEVRPADASKAGAVTQVMAQMPDGIRPVVIGDDVTDEEAMVVAQQMQGVCIRIGQGETCAAYRLAGPPDVLALLQNWVGA